MDDPAPGIAVSFLRPCRERMAPQPLSCLGYPMALGCPARDNAVVAAVSKAAAAAPARSPVQPAELQWLLLDSAH